MNECEHGAIGEEILTCPPCQNTASLPPAEHPDWSRPFPARYEGSCFGCDFVVRPGERVRVAELDNGRKVVAHDNERCLYGP